MAIAKGTVVISYNNAHRIVTDLPALLSSKAVVFDIETTGLNSQWHEIVSFAAKLPDAAYHMSTFIMPKRPKDLLKKDESGQSAYDINGIHPDDLLGSPTFEEAYPEIRQALQGKHWVCWNADFDANFLDVVCDKRGVERIPRAGVSCAMKLLSPLAGLRGQRRGRIERVVVNEDADDRYRKQKLSRLAKRMGIDTRNAHDAAADVDMTIKIMKWASKNLKSLPPPRKSKHVPTQEMAEITLIYSRKGKNGQYWVLQPDHDVDGEAFLFKNQLDQKRFAKCESFIAWLKSMPTGCISRPPAKILIATKVNSQGFTRVASLQCAADIPETQWIENVRQRGDSIRKEWQAGSDWTSDLHGALEIALEQDGYAYVPDEEIGSTISANEREQILDEVILVYQTEGKRIENRVGFAAIVVTPKKTNHVLHLIISFVSGGLWLPMWLLVALKNRDEREILHVNEYGSVTLSPAKGRVLIPK